MLRETTVVGMPVGGLPVEVCTSERDWVVTGVHHGKAFRHHVSPHVTREEAVWLVVRTQRMKADRIDWIRADRRQDVEKCVHVSSLRCGA